MHGDFSLFLGVMIFRRFFQMIFGSYLVRSVDYGVISVQLFLFENFCLLSQKFHLLMSVPKITNSAIGVNFSKFWEPFSTKTNQLMFLHQSLEHFFQLTEKIYLMNVVQFWFYNRIKSQPERPWNGVHEEIFKVLPNHFYGKQAFGFLSSILQGQILGCKVF